VQAPKLADSFSGDYMHLLEAYISN
jgi:hypothetical protein